MDDEIKAKEEKKLFQWDTLSKLADNRVAKLTVIVPIAGYLLLFNDQIIGNLSFETIAGSEPGFFVNTEVKLKFMFFGSLALFIANAIYNIRAPKILTGVQDDISFSERVISAYTVAELVALEEHLRAPGYVLRTPLAADLDKDTARYKLSQNKLSDPVFNQNMNRTNVVHNNVEYTRFAAREYWADQMHSNIWSRYTCLGFTVAGYLMLGTSSLDLIQAVIRDMLL